MADNLNNRIVIFISSSQDEFTELRKELKIDIDNEALKFSGQRIMHGVLIENERGDVISKDIDKWIDRTSIYVGIFGIDYSDWTVNEYKKALSRGLPTLIYRFELEKRSKLQKGRKSKIQRFLDNEVKNKGVRIRGPYRRKQDLIDSVLNDLAIQIIEMVTEDASIRKIVQKCPLLSLRSISG